MDAKSDGSRRRRHRQSHNHHSDEEAMQRRDEYVFFRRVAAEPEPVIRRRKSSRRRHRDRGGHHSGEENVYRPASTRTAALPELAIPREQRSAHESTRQRRLARHDYHSDEEIAYEERHSRRTAAQPESLNRWRGRSPPDFRQSYPNAQIVDAPSKSREPTIKVSTTHAEHSNYTRGSRSAPTSPNRPTHENYQTQDGLLHPGLVVPPPPSPSLPTEPINQSRLDRPMLSVPMTTMPEISDGRETTATQESLDVPVKSRGRAVSAAPTYLPSGRPLSSAASTASSAGILGDRTYCYSELRPFEFRLVRLLPAKMSTIKCEIEHYSLEEPPKYIAISYAWGDIGDTRKIQISGISIPITTSLYGALEAVRQREEPVLVWADALSIDQQNRDERTQQVQMMTHIYRRADAMAIWLGPDADDSSLAMHLLLTAARDPKVIKELMSSPSKTSQFAATVSLFERDYWRRLWVVQEVLNAKTIEVYCGSESLPWKVYQDASRTFKQYRKDLDQYFPGGRGDGKRHIVSQNQLSYSQVLVAQGPGSLVTLMELGQYPLLEALRACRGKLASDPRDKVFGLLGILAEDIRREFPPANYSLSVREVYTDVVDYILGTTQRLDVICEAIYFPLHTSSASLPSWVPDWSHITQVAGLGLSYDFSAGGKTKADFRFVGERRSKLEISAIYLDTIRSHGIAVGTLCTLADYLMAFLHWRALLLGSSSSMPADVQSRDAQEEFCRTLCLDQSVPADPRTTWMSVCFHVFASLISERLPYLPLDRDLRRAADAKVGIDPGKRRHILTESCGRRMMGRCFCLTERGLMGMGTGFMAPRDIVVVPLGCYTPIILRPEGNNGEYRLVGDTYISRYMHGEAIRGWKDGKLRLGKYVLR